MKNIDIKGAVSMEPRHDYCHTEWIQRRRIQAGTHNCARGYSRTLGYRQRTVFVWVENASDIQEEDAARRMAVMAPVAHAHYTEPSEGKVLDSGKARNVPHGYSASAGTEFHWRHHYQHSPRSLSCGGWRTNRIHADHAADGKKRADHPGGRTVQGEKLLELRKH